MPSPPPTLSRRHQLPASSLEGLDCDLVGLELEDLRPDVSVEADEVQIRRLLHPLDRAGREAVRQAEAELGVDLPGLHVIVGRGLDPRGDPDQDVLRTVEHALAAVDLIEGVDDQVADAAALGHPQFIVGLVVAVQVDPRRVEAGGQGHVELTSRCDVDREALLGEQGIGRGAGQRLAGEENLEVVGP